MSTDRLHLYAKPKNVAKIHSKITDEYKQLIYTASTASSSLSSSEAVRRVKEQIDQIVSIPVQILHSSEIEKINEHGRTQKRYLVLTSTALLNIKPSGFKTKRIIPLPSVQRITLSTFSSFSAATEFIVHVKDSYDYFYRSPFAQEICEALAGAAQLVMTKDAPALFRAPPFLVEKIEIEERCMPSLETFVVTKADLKNIMKLHKKALRTKESLQFSDKDGLKPKIENKKSIETEEEEVTKSMDFSPSDLKNASVLLKKTEPIKDETNKKEEIKDFKAMILEAKARLQKPKLEQNDSENEENEYGERKQDKEQLEVNAYIRQRISKIHGLSEISNESLPPEDNFDDDVSDYSV